jgi:hypothetical protein
MPDTHEPPEALTLLFKDTIPDLEMHGWEMTAVEVAYPPAGDDESDAPHW